MSATAIARPARQWTAEAFSAFWARPDPSRLPGVLSILTDDIVGYWPAPIGTVRGTDAYMQVLADILAACPDFSLVAAEYAADGDFHFVRWIATGTGPDGPFECTGCDRVRTRDGLVCENYIFCNDPVFARAVARQDAPAA